MVCYHRCTGAMIQSTRATGATNTSLNSSTVRLGSLSSLIDTTGDTTGVLLFVLTGVITRTSERDVTRMLFLCTRQVMTVRAVDDARFEPVCGLLAVIT